MIHIEAAPRRHPPAVCNAFPERLQRASLNRRCGRPVRSPSASCPKEQRPPTRLSSACHHPAI